MITKCIEVSRKAYARGRASSILMAGSCHVGDDGAPYLDTIDHVHNPDERAPSSARSVRPTCGGMTLLRSPAPSYSARGDR
jgi:hypothetical protein